MIELCNEAQKDMWINIPALATPSYVQSLAQLIDSELDPNLNVYVEYSDETWIAAWVEYDKSSRPRAQTRWSPPQATEGRIAQQKRLRNRLDRPDLRPGFRLLKRPRSACYWHMVNLRSRHGRGPTSIHPKQLRAIPANYVYAVAIAPYVGLPSGDDVAGLTENQLFADLNTTINTQYVSSLQSSATVAQSFGLPLVTYEGGTSLAVRIQRPERPGQAGSAE